MILNNNQKNLIKKKIFLNAFPLGLVLCLFFGQTLYFSHLIINQENKINDLFSNHHNAIALIAKKLEIIDLQMNSNHAALHLQISEAKYKSISTISSGLYNGDNPFFTIITSKPVLAVLFVVGIYYGFSYLIGIESVNKNIKTLYTDFNKKISDLNTNVSEHASQVQVNLSEVKTNLKTVNNSLSNLGHEINFSLSKAKDDTIYQILRFFSYNKKPPGNGGDGGELIESILQSTDGYASLQLPDPLTQFGATAKSTV